MKKILCVLSLVAVSSAYSATNQMLKATLTVVDPASEVILTVSEKAMRFGTVPIVAGGTVESSPVTLKIVGNGTREAQMSFPVISNLTLRGGTETLNIKYVVADIKGGTEKSTSTTYTIVSTGNLGGGTAALSTELKATMALNGTETSGLYEGIVTVDAKYN